MGIIDWRYCTPQNVRPQFFSSEQDHWFLGPMAARVKDREGNEIAAWTYDEEKILLEPKNRFLGPMAARVKDREGNEIAPWTYDDEKILLEPKDILLEPTP